MINARLAMVASLDATLALSIHARRAARRLDAHLLPSAPLLGRPVRRLSRGTAVPGALASFNWRSQRSPWDGGRHQAFRDVRKDARLEARERSLPFAPSAPSRPMADARWEGTLMANGASGDARRSIAPDAREWHTAPAAEAARVALIAPTLAWFCRWREVRSAREREVTAAAPRVSPRMLVRRRLARMAIARAVPDARPPQRAALPHGDGRTPSTASRGAHPVALMRGGAAPETTNLALDAIAFRRISWTLLPSMWSAAAERSPRHPNDAGFSSADASPPALSSPTGGESAVDGVVSMPLRIGARGPAAAVASYADAVTRIVRQRLSADVEEAVARAARKAPAPSSRNDAPRPAVTPRIDDRTVIALIGRMRMLEREERFRHGHLR